MFLCDDCHDKDCPMGFLEDFGRSRGLCEGCRKPHACFDCHGYKVKTQRSAVSASPEDTP